MTAVPSLTHVRVVVDHTLPTNLQRSTKLKILHWFYSSVSLAYHWQVFVFCQRDLKQSFYYTFYYSQPFNEMFIFSGKSRCCKGTVAIYIAASKENLTRNKLLLEISFKLVNSSWSYATKQNQVFLKHTV